MALVTKNFSDIITFTRASTGTYFNAAGTLTSAAINAPRFDYNPATFAAQGLLIEEARTNSIRNNTMVGAVAGSPGTAPTNWSRSPIPTSGISNEIVGTGTESGITYIDLRFTGTATATFSFNTNFETATQVAASPSQTWAVSTYVKLTAGVLNGATISFTVGEYSSVPAFLRNNFSSATTPTSAGLATQRASYSFTTGASTASIQPQISANFTNGLTYDFTLRIGLPQLELGAFATSVIPTTTTVLTRSADVASVNTLSPWFNSAAGTLFAEYNIPFDSSSSIFPLAAGFSDGTFNNTILNYARSVDDSRRVNIRTLGVQQFDAGNGATYTYGTNTKQALAYATNDAALSVAGTAPTTSASVAIPTVNVMGLGSNNFVGGSLSPTNGWLRRIVYYPRRLSNAELQSITS